MNPFQKALQGAEGLGNSLMTGAKYAPQSMGALFNQKNIKQPMIKKPAQVVTPKKAYLNLPQTLGNIQRYTQNQQQQIKQINDLTK